MDFCSAMPLRFLEELDVDADFVPSSQPFEDGEEALHHRGYSNGIDLSSLDFVGTSQPLEDGEDFGMYSGLMTPVRQMSPSVRCEPSAETRCARLVRRASPVKPRPVGASTPIRRSFNLVRRVTMAPDIQRKRQRAHEEAHHILKKLRALAKTTVRLRRKRRSLLAFVTASSEKNKENSFRSQ